jgi:hypothetical protein
MPKTRTPPNWAHYDTLKAQGLSQRQIATALHLSESTLRDQLRHRPPPEDAQGPPAQDLPEVSHSLPEVPQGIPEGSQGPPDLGPPQGALGPPLSVPLSATDLAVLQALLAWWRIRAAPDSDEEEHLVRVTWHVAPRWIEAVRREADRTRDTYAAVVNRALRQYFQHRET